ncbi:MAG: LysE family translocator [Actinobacteria bacterium]|nr:LysE family translocator [Actinomycetota bacterium]
MNNIFEISQIFLSSLIVGFSGAIVPGPMFTMVVTNVAKNGFNASVFIVIGHALTELIILILFLAGILKYLNNEIVIKVIGITGGVALLYLSFDLIYSVLKNKIKISFKKENPDKKEYNKNTGFSFLQGMFVSVINPYWYIWWVTVGAAFLLKSIKYKIFGVSFFYIGHISSDFIWYLIIGFLVSKGRKFLNEKVYKTIIILCGIFLLYSGIKFIIDFIKR